MRDTIDRCLARQGSYLSHGRGADYRIAKTMAAADPTLSLVVEHHPAKGGQPIYGPGGRIKSWGGTAPAYKDWKLVRV